jgi:uncharacterized membrane protein
MHHRIVARTANTCARFITLFALFISGLAHAAEFDPFYRTSFAPPDTIAAWAITSGNWQFANEEFVNSSARALSIATVPTYEPRDFVQDTIGRDYSIDVYALIVSSAANARVGAVFDFTNPNNYHEVTISATGSAQLRSRIGGVSSVVATATSAAPGANRWIHIAVIRSSERTTVRIDGVPVFANLLQEGLPEGDIGLISRNTGARFDDIDARNFGLQDPYVEDFDDRSANRWQPLSGSWSVTSNVYRNSAVVATAITRAPLNEMWETGFSPFSIPYTFKVRMLNPYGGRGNLVGVAWVNDAANYTEAVFSPTGQAQLNRVSNGVRTTIASATYLGGEQNRWFEVEIDHDGNEPQFNPVSHIKVNGVPVFDGIAPNVIQGTLSLITHFAPARFDDVRAAVGFFEPFFEDFSSSAPPLLFPATTWTMQDGMLTNSAIVSASVTSVADREDWHELEDIEFRARMINRFGGSGNRVGFVYGARGPVYYEAVFSPTGVAHLRKVAKGMPIPIATAQYAGGEQGQWFDAQLYQIGDRTTVKVNGVTVFSNVRQPDAVGGKLGFVAHFTNASVDDVSFTQIPITRYRATQLPDLVNPGGESGPRALNDRGEVAGASRDASGVTRAVLWRGGRVIELGANLGSGSIANDINNQSEIVGDHLNAIGFHWEDGEVRDLFPECNRSEATDINDRGQIVGMCGAGGDGSSALLRQPDGTIRLLDNLPGGTWSKAWAINDGGEVVGSADDPSEIVVDPVSWQGDTVEPLGLVGSALDINNRAQIVGVTMIGYQRAVLWDNREQIVLPPRVGENHAQAMGLNGHAVVVGAATTSHVLDPRRATSATMWQAGRIADLNELIACGSLPQSAMLVTAWDINERGQIAVGASDFSATGVKAFLLTPVSGRESCN